MIKKRAAGGTLFLGEMLTASAMAFFEDEIARAVVLALFVPLINLQRWQLGLTGVTL